MDAPSSVTDPAQQPQQQRPTRILIADDHAVVREGLASLIGRRPNLVVVGQASNGHEALKMFRVHQPDITLMDLRMPECDGITSIQAIRREFPNARIIVLTTYEGDEDIYRALHAGAKGYLLKDAGRETLMEAIRSVQEGRTYLPPEVGAKLAERVGASELTPREQEVLRLVAVGMTNQQIGSALRIVEGTVKIHVNSLLGKLGAADRTQAVMIALRRGILHLE